jgi:hypothetical protein
VPTTIGFHRVKAYLDAVAAANGTLPGSPHGDFWNVPYAQFIAGNVPGVDCKGSPVVIIRKDNPGQSPFFLILTTPAGWCGMPQMPEGGPFISDDQQPFTLADGTSVSGKQIRDDLATWLANGFPQNPTPF